MGRLGLLLIYVIMKEKIAEGRQEGRKNEIQPDSFSFGFWLKTILIIFLGSIEPQCLNLFSEILREGKFLKTEEF